MTNPALHSHTHCQAAQANAKTQAWRQRVSVPTLDQTDRKPTDEKEARCPNTGLAKVAVQCSADSFVVNQSSKLNFFINRNVALAHGTHILFKRLPRRTMEWQKYKG